MKIGESFRRIRPQDIVPFEEGGVSPKLERVGVLPFERGDGVYDVATSVDYDGKSARIVAATRTGLTYFSIGQEAGADHAATSLVQAPGSDAVVLYERPNQNPGAQIIGLQERLPLTGDVPRRAIFLDHSTVIGAGAKTLYLYRISEHNPRGQLQVVNGREIPTRNIFDIYPHEGACYVTTQTGLYKLSINERDDMHWSVWYYDYAQSSRNGDFNPVRGFAAYGDIGFVSLGYTENHVHKTRLIALDLLERKHVLWRSDVLPIQAGRIYLRDDGLMLITSSNFKETKVCVGRVNGEKVKIVGEFDTRSQRHNPGDNHEITDVEFRPNGYAVLGTVQDGIFTVDLGRFDQTKRKWPITFANHHPILGQTFGITPFGQHLLLVDGEYERRKSLRITPALVIETDETEWMKAIHMFKWVT